MNVTDKAESSLAILILEDDAALCNGIKLTLAADDRQFEPCHTISEAKAALHDGSPDLFILDINLPDGSGLDFCAQLRSAGYTAPVLMLTANDTELDMVAGLECGADDYVTKPFSLAVFRARVDALLRRGTYGGGKVEVGGFVFDFESLRFEKNSQPVELFDPRWCAEALFNIIDNAVKYTPEGGKVGVTVTEYEMFARIDVIDTGRGIREEDLPKVFTRFWRAAESADSPGVGLGLYLAREIIVACGGYIKAGSEYGNGAVFSAFLSKM